jgi:hypothetical protein
MSFVLRFDERRVEIEDVQPDITAGLERET